MNKIFEKLFGETANGIANIVDRFVQTKEEKHKANQEIQQLFQSFEIEMQKNTTERWKYDSTSDSWLSKNIRNILRKNPPFRKKNCQNLTSNFFLHFCHLQS